MAAASPKQRMMASAVAHRSRAAATPRVILAVDRYTRRVQHLRFRENGAQTREDAHLTVHAGGAPPRAAHLGRRIRERTQYGEPPRRAG